jgi:transcriptional antiterminator RfaH
VELSAITNARAARWYLILSKPAREPLAQLNLERQGYAVYYPRLVHPLRIRGRWAQRVVPLFPRYMFVHLEVGKQPLAPVQSTAGVATAVRFGCDYAVVPDEVVDQLRARADPATGLHRLGDPARPFTPGSKVRIVAGAFDGLEGVFQRAIGAERVIILLRVLGQDTPVSVDAGFVLPESTGRVPAQFRCERRVGSC